MKKKSICVLLALSMITLTMAACGKATEAPASTGATEATEEEVTEVMAEPATEEEATEEENSVYSMPNSAYSSTVVLAGDRAYFLGNDEIMTLDIATGKSEVVWISDAEYRDQYAFSQGSGLLLGDNLYFVRCINDETGSYCSSRELNKYNLTTNSIEAVGTFSSDNYCTGNMYYTDGVLYADLNGINDCFQIDEDGNVVKAMNRADIEEYAMVPEGYSLTTYESGRKTLFPKESYSQNGKLILSNTQSDVVIYDPASKRETELGGFVIAINDKNVLIETYDSGKYAYGLINRKTGEYKYLASLDDYYSSIGIDDEYSYFSQANEETGATEIGSISLADGKISIVYTAPVSETRLEVTLAYIASPVKIGNFVFTIESHDCGLYPAVINLDTKEMTVGDTWYYQSGIAGVGTIVRGTYSKASDFGQVLVTAKSALININDSYKGAEKINATMNARLDELVSRAEDAVPEAQSWYEESVEFAKENDTEVYFTPYSYTETVDDIDYLTDSVICFRVNGYDYLGGAHGTPYQEAYIFDLETGERKNIGDFITISEEELKDVVTAAVAKKMEAEGRDMYWDDAEQSVHEVVSKEYTNAYLTNDGIVFYFDPYLLASYAQGFVEVEIPYEDLQKAEE